MRVVFVGGSGFIGKSFADWVIRYQKKITLILASRNPEKTAGSLFLKYVLNNSKIKIISINSPEFLKEISEADAIIYAASSSQESLYVLDPEGVAKDDFMSLEQVLKKLSKRSRLIYLSSGAIYGQQLELGLMSETGKGVPWPIGSSKRVYADIKVRAEEMVCKASIDNQFSLVIARLFAFCGPWLPTNSHFLIGNMIESIETKTAIKVKAMRPIYRSYMSSDMLCNIIFRLIELPLNRELVLNIGSQNIYEMHHFAENLAQAHSLPYSGFVDKNEEKNGDIYIPDISSLRELLDSSFKDEELFAVVESTLRLREKLRAMY
jgi:nucleoside-diphosphate-sugar epimerase